MADLRDDLMALEKRVSRLEFADEVKTARLDNGASAFAELGNRVTAVEKDATTQLAATKDEIEEKLDEAKTEIEEQIADTKGDVEIKITATDAKIDHLDKKLSPKWGMIVTVAIVVAGWAWTAASRYVPPERVEKIQDQVEELKLHQADFNADLSGIHRALDTIDKQNARIEQKLDQAIKP